MEFKERDYWRIAENIEIGQQFYLMNRRIMGMGKEALSKKEVKMLSM